jgi:hypothetical protein
MNRKSVESSNILSIGYDYITMILEVEFKYSGIYHYSEVPQEIYDALMTANSKGKYLNANIKGVYSYIKL